MLKCRIIPSLLLRGQGLVKTVRFKDPVYVGDPVNAVKIFNDRGADELALLDITATPEGRGPDFDAIGAIASEAFMPMGYGGGIRSIADIRTLFRLGFEKAIINSAAFTSPDLVAQAARTFGNQSIVVSIDAKKNWFGTYEVYSCGGRKKMHEDPVTCARRMEALGAGEILLNAIDRDGTRQGGNIELIRSVTGSVSIPVIACGGMGSLADVADAVHQGGASGVAAGSLFVFYGRHKAVLINYPSTAEIDQALALPPTSVKE